MKQVQEIGKMFVKNSPSILTGLSVAGLITTAVLAVEATPRALEILDNARCVRECQGEDRPINKKDAFLLTWKCYIPAATMGLVSIGCIISSNTINIKRNAAMASLYSISNKTLREYQAKVVETMGEKKANKIKEEIAVDRIKNNPVISEKIINTGNGETLCYDMFSGRYFKSDIESIKRAMNKLSRDLLSDHFITMNTVYSELGLKEVSSGDVLGWHVDDGLIEPQFTSQLTDDGIPCLVLDYYEEPRVNPAWDR